MFEFLDLISSAGDNTFTLEDTTISDILKTFEGYYLKKDYANALATLQSNSEKINYDVWHFNMGTTLAQMNRLPEARFHLLKAVKSGLAKPTFQNLELVEEKLEIPRLEKPLSMTDYLIKGSLIAAEGWLTTLSLLFLLIGIFVFRKGASIKKMSLIFLAVILPLVVNFMISNIPLQVSMKSLILREGPSEIFMERGEVPAGVLIITKERDGWSEIIFPSRFSGWIHDTSNLKRL